MTISEFGCFLTTSDHGHSFLHTLDISSIGYMFAGGCGYGGYEVCLKIFSNIA
jgi:hypothetical protein